MMDCAKPTPVITVILAEYAENGLVAGVWFALPGSVGMLRDDEASPLQMVAAISVQATRGRSRTMPKNDDSYLERAREYWQGGEPLEAGRLIHDNLPSDARPAWAARILRLVLDRTGADHSHFERILYTADHPRQWANGHRCFDLLRVETLKCDDLRRRGRLTKDQEIFASLLLLAELVAKVSYNAVDPPDEFDEDSGWWIAESLRGFVDLWKDDEFSQTAWSALCCGES